jgi:hypothetical protein
LVARKKRPSPTATTRRERRLRNAEERDAEEPANAQMFGEGSHEFLTTDEFIETLPKFL